MDSELRRYIDKEIDRKVNIILHGVTDETSTGTETINDLFPGQPGITNRPVSHPFGFVSRAVKGTLSVVARVGEHIGNRIVIGHRDKNRPSLNEGECALYSRDGYTIRVLNGKVEIGKGTAFQTLIVGEDLMTFLAALIDAIVAHNHMGNLGAPTGPPLNAETFNTLKADPVQNGKLLVKDGGKF